MRQPPDLFSYGRQTFNLYGSCTVRVTFVFEITNRQTGWLIHAS